MTQTKRREKRHEVKRQGIRRSVIRRVMQAFAPYRARLLVVLIAIVVTALLGLLSPLAIRSIFDDAIPHRNTRLLLIAVLTLIAVPILTGGISFVQVYLSSLVGQRVIRDFRNQLYAQLQRMSLRFFTSTRVGEIEPALCASTSHRAGNDSSYTGGCHSRSDCGARSRL